MTVTLVVTGFSRFHSVENNPTEALVNWLAANQLSIQQDNGSALTFHSLNVLPVSARDVDEWLQEAVQKVEERCQDQTVVFLHLGVDTKGTCLQLESQAFNSANFRVPDERGWQPSNQLIDDSDTERGLEYHCNTDIPLQSMLEMLAEQGHELMISQDAGRFVCNYTYYQSLAATSRHPHWHSLFVHVPNVQVTSLEKQQSFIKDLIGALVIVCGGFEMNVPMHLQNGKLAQALHAEGDSGLPQPLLIPVVAL